MTSNIWLDPLVRASRFCNHGRSSSNKIVLCKPTVSNALSETFGARHLGEPAGGRAEGWKSFVKTLDGLELSAEEEADLDKGAVAAFERFTVLLEHAYAAEPELA